VACPREDRVSGAEIGGVWAWLAVVLALIATIGVGLLAFTVSELGRAPGLVIQNRTDERLEIFSLDPRGEIQSHLFTISPGSSIETGLGCPVDLVALDRSNQTVSTRPALGVCNLEDWIIKEP
jgi:hypothetical protein